MSNIHPSMRAMLGLGRRQTIETLMMLDDRLLRDIGLTRGIMAPRSSADRRPRGLYADMIQERLRRF